MYDSRLSLKQVILDISSMRKFAAKLLKEENSYNPILEYIISRNIYYDEDAKLPLIKDILKELNITYSKFKKELIKLYYELIDQDYFDPKIPFYFDEVEYFFSLKSFDKYAHFTVKELKHVPRVGEVVEVPYFRAKLGGDYFYVERITNEFWDGKQIVHFSLKRGMYNLYWHIRKDEAEIKREVSLNDLFDLEDYELQKKLGL